MNQNRGTTRPAVSKKALVLLEECEKWRPDKNGGGNLEHTFAILLLSRHFLLG